MYQHIASTSTNEISHRLRMFASPGVSLSLLGAVGTTLTTSEYGDLTDLESGCWAAGLGHSRPEILEAIQTNVGTLFHTHQYMQTPHPNKLVEELCIAAGLPCDYKGSFMSSGTEAVSAAIMLADQVTGRKKHLSLSISYLGSSPDLRMPRNPTNWLDLDVSTCINCERNESCELCGRFSTVDWAEFSSFVFEPGNSGGIVAFVPDKLVQYISEQIRAAGGCIVANEITTGFGRTGKWFGYQHYDCLTSKDTSPDFIAMGKCLGNGYPISGVLAKAGHADKIMSSGFRYVQSHTDDPLGCIIARTVIESMVKDKLLQRSTENGAYLRHRLESICADNSALQQIRGRGMMNVCTLDHNHSTTTLFQQLLTHGFFCGFAEAGPHNLLRFYTPFPIERSELDRLCDTLANLLA